MAILTGPRIEELVRNAEVSCFGTCPVPYLNIVPFEAKWCGPNSYDVHLSDELLVYDLTTRFETDAAGNAVLVNYLDSRRENPTVRRTIPPEGLVVRPGEFYLGATVERLSVAGLVPFIDGRSSVGRLSVSIHQTAGRGDDGWGWLNGEPYPQPLTLEISAVLPTKIYAGDRIGQLTFFTLEGPRRPYVGRYVGSDGVVASRFHLECNK